MFGINNNLFGYIGKLSEMTDDIVQRYKNSLIFIGDEKQIYVPTTNSYVGVGVSAVTNIKNSLSSVDKIFISDYANNSLASPNTTYYFPVISGNNAPGYYYTYVALSVGVNPYTSKFIGGLEGIADYSNISYFSNKVLINENNEDKQYFITFSDNSNYSYSYINENLQYNPFTNTITCGTFVGNLEGDSINSTYSTYSTYSSYSSYSFYNEYQHNYLAENDYRYLISFSDGHAYSQTYVNNAFYYNPYLGSAYSNHFYGIFHGDTDMFTNMHSGTIYSYDNIIVHENTYVKIGSTELGTGYSATHIINDLNGQLSSSYEENINLETNINGVSYNVSLSYLYSTYLGGTRKEELFTFFGDGNEDQTAITIGGITYSHTVNAAYLQGFHAANLLTKFEGGELSSENNTITREKLEVTVGGTSNIIEEDSCYIINSAEWSYVGSETYGDDSYNLILRYKVNGVDSTYTYLPKIYAYSATYLNGAGLSELFTFFGDGNEDQTAITIGGVTYSHTVNAAYLQGFHAANLLTKFEGGELSSKNNTITREELEVVVGGTSNIIEEDSCYIINSAEWSYVGSETYGDDSYNLILRYKINGVDSTYAYLPKIYAYSASYLNGAGLSELFTFFGDGHDDNTRITVGTTSYEHAINAAYLQGFHAANLLTKFEGGELLSKNNTITREELEVVVGGTSNIIEEDSCYIINSAEWSYVGSETYGDDSYNLILRYKVNGVDSTYAYLPKIYAYSASYLDGLGRGDLFTFFGDGSQDDNTRITVGEKSLEHYVNAAYLQGFHAANLLTKFEGGELSSKNNTITREELEVVVGGTSNVIQEDSCYIINSAEWSYVGSETYGDDSYNLILRYKVNGVDSTYAYLPKLYAYSASYLNGAGLSELFTFFGDGHDDNTRITVGTTSYEHAINAAYLQGFHANGLITKFEGGKLSSENNTLKQSAQNVTVGGTTYTINENTCDIINSANWSYVGSNSYTGSNNAYNLILRYKVNGVDSTYAYLPKLYAYSASYLNGAGLSELFTFFGDGHDDNTRITVGTTSYEHAINAAYLQGFHANGLLTKFEGGKLSSENNTLKQSAQQVTVGGTSYTINENTCNIINSAEWAYVGSNSYTGSNNAYNLILRYKVNGFDSTYAYLPKIYAYSASYLNGAGLSELLTFFGNGQDDNTRITVGEKSLEHYVNAAYLQGFHANGLITKFEGGELSSENNTITREELEVVVGGTSYIIEEDSCDIINSAEWSYVGSLAYSNNTNNLTLRYKVNGIESSYATIHKLYAYSASYLNGAGLGELLTLFDRGSHGDDTKITVGTKSLEHYVNAAYLQGFHANGLITKFEGGKLSSNNNILKQSAQQVTVGGTTYTINENTCNIINSAEWSYVGSNSYTGSNNAYNLILRYKVNGVDSTYAYIPKIYAYSASYLNGVGLDGLLTFFGNGSHEDDTMITVSGTSKSHYVNASYLQGFHANGLLTKFEGGELSSEDNTITREKLEVVVGGTSNVIPKDSCYIINSAEWAYVGSLAYSNNTNNLTLRYKVNGKESSYATIHKLYAYSAKYLDNTSISGLFTFFGNGNDDKTTITIGGTTLSHYVNASYLQGFHANGLLTKFEGGELSSENNTITREKLEVVVGGTSNVIPKDSCYIINSAEWSYVGSLAYSNNTNNLTLRYKVNGEESSYATIHKLYAYSAKYLDNTSISGLFTFFGNGNDDKTAITVGGTTLSHYVNAAYLQGYHINIGERNNEINKIVRTDASGHLQTGIINTETLNLNSTSFDKIYVSNNDNISYVTKAKFAEALVDPLLDADVITFERSLKVTEAWMDTGITTTTGAGKNFPRGNGTYVIQISHGDLTTPASNGYASMYSGIITIYNGTNATDQSEEIILHRSGKSWVNRIYLRTVQTAQNPGYCKIQIATSKTWTAASTVTFKFRKMI